MLTATLRGFLSIEMQVALLAVNECIYLDLHSYCVSKALYCRKPWQVQPLPACPLKALQLLGGRWLPAPRICQSPIPFPSHCLPGGAPSPLPPGTYLAPAPFPEPVLPWPLTHFYPWLSFSSCLQVPLAPSLQGQPSIPLFKPQTTREGLCASADCYVCRHPAVCYLSPNCRCRH